MIVKHIALDNPDVNISRIMVAGGAIRLVLDKQTNTPMVCVDDIVKLLGYANREALLADNLEFNKFIQDAK